MENKERNKPQVYVHKAPYSNYFHCLQSEHDDPLFGIGDLPAAKKHTRETGHEVQHVRCFIDIVSTEEEIDFSEELSS